MNQLINDQILCCNIAWKERQASFLNGGGVDGRIDWGKGEGTGKEEGGEQ